MFKTLFKRHSSGLMVCANGSVFVPATRSRKAHWTFGTPCSYQRRYRRVKFNGKNYLVHRLVAESFLDNPCNLPYVDHIDRNPTNNAVENLRWVTPQTNRLNTDVCDNSLSKYGVRSSDDRAEYQRRYRNTPEGRERIRMYNLRSKLKAVA